MHERAQGDEHILKKLRREGATAALVYLDEGNVYH